MQGLFDARLRLLFGLGLKPASLAEQINGLPTGDDETICRFVMDMTGSELASLPVKLRYDLIEKLGPLSRFAKPHSVTRRDFIATLLLITQPYPKAYEAFEDEWVSRLGQSRTVRTMLPERNILLKAGDTVNEYIVTFARHLLQDQSDIFRAMSGVNWVTMAKTITWYSLGLADYRARQVPGKLDLYSSATHIFEPLAGGVHSRYPGLRTTTGQTIAFNLHPDAGPFTPAEIARQASHEQVHDVCLQLLNPPDGAATDTPMMLVMDSVAREAEMEHFLLHNFSRPVYRTMMLERLAFGFGEKHYLSLDGKTPRREVSRTKEDIQRLHGDWMPDIERKLSDIFLVPRPVPVQALHA